ncbi:hypothetical protein CKO11_17045 [Rhodobacter sp. TJ_12]|uniref:hypothetical protein n=1 Tax=Rhodobacter sp. TJ_12 TaxID=2029399 RepID=UPI001CBC3014|nr:hypothetical protein [Rhodobacter sp. TJ_12]MBZ4024153.1 hypothetical protein [Rhodobacter sp. TJ_12]
MKSTILATALLLSLTAPAIADPTLGFGLSLSFGAGKVDTGIGLRVFSDDKQDNFVGSLGVDYMFGGREFRPTIGAAYLGKNSYIGLDLGYGLKSRSIDFGLGVGGTNTSIGGPGNTGGGGETTPGGGSTSPL